MYYHVPWIIKVDNNLMVQNHPTHMDIKHIALDQLQYAPMWDVMKNKISMAYFTV